MGKFKDLAIKKGNTERWAFPTSTRELPSYVEEGNKLIASFEGFKTYVMNGYLNVEYSDDNIRTIQDTHYHSSWDWLMPVVQKIKDTPTYGSTDGIDFVLNCDLTKENLYKSVVEFIKYHNEEKN